MALVVYGSSDSSDLDDEDSIPINQIASLTDDIKKPSSSASTGLNASNVSEDSNLFGTLPKPIQKDSSLEEDDEFLHKKESTKRDKAKISIPSLLEFKDLEDGPTIRKPALGNGKKSGLLSMLPEPKFSGSSTKKSAKPLIPNVVERKIINIAPNPPAKLEGQSSLKLQPPTKKPLLCTNYSDSDDDDDVAKSSTEDFFSIYSQPAPAVSEESLIEPIIEDNITNNHTLSEVAQQSMSNRTLYQEDTAPSSHHQCNAAAPNEATSSSDWELDDEAIRQLCGTRKRQKKEDIKVITVDQQQVLSDSREWLIKGLMDDTSKRVSSSKRKGNEPTSQQKRKHQITYLAHQAKANEAELQNQWANNRMSKRQTQSKYGF